MLPLMLAAPTAHRSRKSTSPCSGNEAAVGGPVAAYLYDAGAPVDRTTALDGDVTYVQYGAALDLKGSTDDEIGAGEIDNAAGQTGGGAGGNDEVSFGRSCDDADEQSSGACDQPHACVRTLPCVLEHDSRQAPGRVDDTPDNSSPSWPIEATLPRCGEWVTLARGLSEFAGRGCCKSSHPENQAATDASHDLKTLSGCRTRYLRHHHQPAFRPDRKEHR